MFNVNGVAKGARKALDTRAQGKKGLELPTHTILDLHHLLAYLFNDIQAPLFANSEIVDAHGVARLEVDARFDAQFLHLGFAEAVEHRLCLFFISSLRLSGVRVG